MDIRKNNTANPSNKPTMTSVGLSERTENLPRIKYSRVNGLSFKIYTEKTDGVAYLIVLCAYAVSRTLEKSINNITAINIINGESYLMLNFPISVIPNKLKQIFHVQVIK